MKDNDQEGINLVVQVMDAIENYQDDLGYCADEVREDYAKFGTEVYIPSGWTGKNAQGAELKNGVTFIDIRPKYKQDPQWEKVENFLNGGDPPHFTYHRFWAQTEIAVANGLLSIYGVSGSGSTGGGSGGGSSGDCAAAIKQQGYKCCKPNCEIIYTDGDGNWGVENGEWCGCGGGTSQATAKCPEAITKQGYKCCSSCSFVYYTDSDGNWGVENNQWCGMPTNC